LEERNVVPDFIRFVARGAKGECSRKFSNDLHKALFPVLLFENVLLRGRNERQGLHRAAIGPITPIKPVQHVAGILGKRTEEKRAADR